MIAYQPSQAEILDYAERAEIAEMLRWSRQHAPGLIHFAEDPDPVSAMRKAYRVIRPAVEAKAVGR